MIESLDPSLGLMSDLGLFSSESVMLDLDSNLAFENISWINEDLFTSNVDRYDHTYSQRTGCEEGTRQEIVNNEDEKDSRVEILKIGVTSFEPSVENDTEFRTGEVPGANTVVSNNRRDLGLQLNNNGLPDLQDTGHSVQNSHSSTDNTSSVLESRKLVPESVCPESSLSYLLEETCLDYNMDSLLDEEFELNNVIRVDHSQTAEESNVPSLGLQSCSHNGDSHSLVNNSLVTSETGLDNSLLMLNEHNCDGFLAAFSDTQSDQSSLTNLDLSNAFDSLTRLDMCSSEDSDWSTLSTGVSDFSLDWGTNYQEPLSLEELFTRTFNEALDMGAPQVPSQECFFHPEVYSDQTDATQWSNVGWDTNGLIQNTGDNSPEMNYTLLPSHNETTYQVSTESMQGEPYSSHPASNEFTRRTKPSLSKRKPAPSNADQLSRNDQRSDQLTNKHRLAQVRKYQRLNPSSSESLTRSFQCSFPECRKFYAKLSHLKAHLRRHSGERAFKCDWQDCSWQFSRSDELSRHRRSHYGIKPYPCTLCTKRFTRSDHLAKHLKVHERQKYKMMMKSMRKMKNKK